jgi:hypothetical protein
MFDKNQPYPHNLNKLLVKIINDTQYYADIDSALANRKAFMKAIFKQVSELNDQRLNRWQKMMISPINH